MRIYVGNLSYEVTADDIREEFAPFGEVGSVQLITDRDTGRSKGFAFVEMPNLSEGQKAIAELNDKPLLDRNMTVNPARERTGGDSYGSRGGRRDDRGGGFGGGYGRGRGGRR